MQVYETGFAKYYDLILYGGEEAVASQEDADFVEKMFSELSRAKVKHVLDAGCGTGRFTLPLSQRGYAVTAMDASMDMLAECGRKLKHSKLKAEMLQQDIEKMEFREKFDAAICFDSVICYFLKQERIQAALKRFSAALKPGGVLILENWNMYNQPHLINNESKFKRKEDGVELEITEKSFLDEASRVLTIQLDVRAVDGITGKTEFAHVERLMIPSFREMETMMEKAGFTGIRAYSGFNMSGTDDPEGTSMIFAGVKKG